MITILMWACWLIIAAVGVHRVAQPAVRAQAGTVVLAIAAAALDPQHRRPLVAGAIVLAAIVGVVLATRGYVWVRA